MARKDLSSFEADALKTRDLVDLLGWRDGVSISDLTAALMSALNRIAALEDEANGDNSRNSTPPDGPDFVVDPRD